MTAIYDWGDVADATEVLDSYVRQKARESSQQLHFTYTAAADAPDNYSDLLAAFERSKSTGEPLPVSSLHCDNVIYGSDATNHAMRFWHDTLHVTTGLSFSLDDELELGLHHLSIAEGDGIQRGSLAWQMLKIDMLGQNYLLGVAKRFPINQVDFVYGCIELGIDEGILKEARRTP